MVTEVIGKICKDVLVIVIIIVDDAMIEWKRMNELFDFLWKLGPLSTVSI